MSKLTNKLTLATFSAVLSLTPALIFAEKATDTCGYNSDGSLTVCGTEGLSSVGLIILKVTQWLLGFAGAVAVLFIIFGGIKYVTAAGNEKQAESAKQTLTYAVIGIIVILLSTVIVTLVANSIGSVASTVTP